MSALSTLRVLQVDVSAEWRGGQVQTLLLVRGLAARGVDVRVACPEEGRLWAELEGVCPRVSIPVGRSLRAVRELRSQDVDLVAAQSSHAHTVGLAARRPLVVHRRVDFPVSGGWKYQRPDAFVAVSEAVARILRQAGAREVLVVPDGVPRPAGPPATAAFDAPEVLAVGALVPHKGHAVLAEAAQLLEGVDVAVAGDGKLRFRALRHLGHREDIPALLAGTRVFVHPSLEEGMGQAVVEALAAGVPVVVSDAGGLPETVGDAALVVPRGDADALAAALRRALAGEHPPPEAGRARARRYSVEAMVDGTLAAYAQVVAGRRARGGA